MGRRVYGTKLIDGSYRRPHTKQERTQVQNAEEQGVKPRRTHLPSSWDDIHIDKGKIIPYNTEDSVSHKNWKAKAKCRKQWERKGNIVFVGDKQHRGRWSNYDWKKVNLEEKI